MLGVDGKLLMGCLRAKITRTKKTVPAIIFRVHGGFDPNKTIHSAVRSRHLVRVL
jgi:hypothetical protein